jgi:hypothetical protein
LRRTIKEECEIDWKSQAIPFRIGQVELRQESGLSRYQLESAAGHILKPERARIAGANYPSGRGFQQMAMIGRELYAAKFTTLFDRCRPAKTPQGR